ncbi:MAG: sodium-dependent bicarbonate transport family permease [Geminicoccaceae bacterium]|nr:MAG: sodium-dependent bicarbonate transport family permease [Geminicoccaceae bacterium]
MDAALANLLSPPVLCFLLGLAAGIVRSDLEIPEAVARALALYLIFSIGFKGGVELAGNGDLPGLLPPLLVAAGLSLLLPLPAYGLLRLLTRVSRVDAGAIAAHYGSVSIVTYVAATSFLQSRGIPYEGFLAAVVAVMETPAILTGLLLARRGERAGLDARRRRELAHEILANGSVVLLLGSFAIGLLTGAEGMRRLEPVVASGFQGVLCFFLLDMGLLVARRFAGFATMRAGLLAFGLLMPLLGASAGLTAGWALGLSHGGAALFATLAASASYIAVPAAMRLALPRANPSLSLSLALGITFPFNLVVGIPLYVAMAGRLVG